MPFPSLRTLQKHTNFIDSQKSTAEMATKEETAQHEDFSVWMLGKMFTGLSVGVSRTAEQERVSFVRLLHRTARGAIDAQDAVVWQRGAAKCLADFGKTDDLLGPVTSALTPIGVAVYTHQVDVLAFLAHIAGVQPVVEKGGAFFTPYAGTLVMRGLEAAGGIRFSALGLALHLFGIDNAADFLLARSPESVHSDDCLSPLFAYVLPRYAPQHFRAAELVPCPDVFGKTVTTDGLAALIQRFPLAAYGREPRLGGVCGRSLGAAIAYMINHDDVVVVAADAVPQDVAERRCVEAEKRLEVLRTAGVPFDDFVASAVAVAAGAPSVVEWLYTKGGVVPRLAHLLLYETADTEPRVARPEVVEDLAYLLPRPTTADASTMHVLEAHLPSALYTRLLHTP